jgi:hypothetical protein
MPLPLIALAAALIRAANKALRLQAEKHGCVDKQ